MTVVTAKDAPTIRFLENEQVGSGSKGLAILVAESVYFAPQGDVESETVPRGTIAQHGGLILDAIQKFQGQIVRTLGNSLMAEFADLGAAVRAAVTMQRLHAE